jgi:hypothetical protein
MEVQVLRRMVLTALLLVGSHRAWAGEREMIVNSVPIGAHVEFGGSEIGVTPVVMTLPTAFFQAPMTIWARHLSTPLKLTFSLSGYQTKTVELGDGPNNWSSLNGSNHFDYYLLHPSYTITLDRVPPPPTTPTATSASDAVAVANALEKLAKLREQGLLTDAEFQSQKKALLGIPASPNQEPANSSQIDPVHFCSQLLEATDTTHKLDTSSSPLLTGAHGPIVRCLWKTPAPGVQSMSFYVQCELPTTAAACQAIGATTGYAGDDPHIACRTTLGSDLAYVFDNKCVAFLSAAGEQATVDPIAARVIAAFIVQHSR